MEQQVSEAQESTESQSSVASEGTLGTTPPAAQEADELKVVIQLKGERAIIVVGSPGCDPVIHMAEAPTNLEGTYDLLWLEVDNAITRARVQWAQAKQYPAYKAPAPPPRPVVATKPRMATTAKGTAKGKPAQEQAVQHGLPLL